ncbi:tetratricopeptide repeat protein [Lachnobacterium bovis]|uniref:TolA-binding protein n=1 Tax=Lachnobacterium bovis TaxID=140626 RepID=A0A1H9UL21_9FIRM|nr:tetratricopeptide repeat protein [Lachnobacterium bovis]SES10155.1 TolA-binding protein [Lachnobacterium bovis]
MICYKCRKDAHDEKVCPYCGTNLKIYYKVKNLSNIYYNDALEKAKIRDLSGAVVSLRSSLKFNKYNIQARNLLGLIYFELGEFVDALCEWVISKNYQKEDNLANKYLAEIQDNQGRLEAISNTIKKYNQAYSLCVEGNIDMAIIQLKKLITMNYKMVKSYQLLALIYMKEEKYDQAKKILREAQKIDTDNPLTSRYIKIALRELKKKPRVKKHSNDTITYMEGNDKIIRPRRFQYYSVGSSLLYLIMGLVLGTLAVAFLLLPNAQKNANTETNQKLKSANETVSTKEGEITSLKSKIKELENKLKTDGSTADQMQNTKNTYESLLNAYVMYTGKDYVGAGDLLAGIDTKYLSENAVNTYNTINAQIGESYMNTLFAQGTNSYRKNDYQGAITNLLKVVNRDPAYKAGDASFYLAQAYGKAGDIPSAQKYYQYIMDTFPATKKASVAKNFMMTHPAAPQPAADPNAQQQQADPNAQQQQPVTQ